MSLCPLYHSPIHTLELIEWKIHNKWWDNKTKNFFICLNSYIMYALKMSRKKIHPLFNYKYQWEIQIPLSPKINYGNAGTILFFPPESLQLSKWCQDQSTFPIKRIHREVSGLHMVPTQLLRLHGPQVEYFINVAENLIIRLVNTPVEN